MTSVATETSPVARALVSRPEQPRVRRASDAMGVLIGIGLMLWATTNVRRTDRLNEALAGVVDVLPGWTLEPLSVVYSLGFLAAVGVVLLLVLGGRDHRDALRDVALAVLLAAAIGTLLVRVFQGAWPYVVPELGLERPERQTPVFRIAITSAVLVAASPHLAQPLRRVGWGLVAASVLAGSGLGFGLPSDAVGAVGLGMAAAGVVLLTLGAPMGLPDLATIATALANLGVPVRDLEVPASRSWGVRRVLGRHVDGGEVVVKVYGRDAADQQSLSRWWQRLWYREPDRTLPRSRLQAVQQEALLTLWAARSGANVREVLAAGEPDAEVAVLALRTGGTRLDRLAPQRCTDAVLAELWAQVSRLHDAGIAHGALDTRSVRVGDGDGQDVEVAPADDEVAPADDEVAPADDEVAPADDELAPADDEVVLEDLGAGALSATEAQQGRDVAGLLFGLAALAGPARAVASARLGLGDERLVKALPYLQLPALPTRTRELAPRPKTLLAELTDTLRSQLDRELPTPVELRRVRPRSLVVALLAILAAWTLVPVVAGIDLTAVAAEFGEARWLWVGVAALIGQGVFFSEAASMRFATTAAVPFRPLVVLQVAAKLVGVVTPGVTGTVATNAAFLSRYGVSPAASLTQGGMDAAAGLLVEATLLILAFTFLDLDLGIDLGGSEFAIGRLVVGVVVLLAIAVTALLAVPRLRAPVARLMATVGGAVRAVVAEPSRAVGLVGANLVTRVVRALVLWSALQALGQPLGLGVVLVVVVAAGLLQGVVPVPGGIGVAEAVITSFLVALGVPEAPAFAATVLYRAIVFYLPILQGGVAMGWLTRNGHL